MSVKNSIKIVLTDDNVKILRDIEGDSVSRNISVDELIAAMSDGIILRTGIMSPGIREYYVCGETEVVVVECAPKIREVSFRREGQVKIPYPPLLFFFGLKNGKMNNSSVFAIKEPFTDPKMPLYSFPLGDSDPHSGTICWGHNSSDSNYIAMNKVCDYSVANIQGLIVRFFSGKFNNNFTGSNSCFHSPKDAKSRVSCATELVKYLKERRVFPLDILKESRAKYEDIIVCIRDSRSTQYH